MDGNTGHGGIMVVRRIVRDAGVRIDGQPESKLCSLLKPGKEQEEPLSAR